MALTETVKTMSSIIDQISVDLKKATEKGNKTAAQRVRTNTIKFAKLSKIYRKESMSVEKRSIKKKKLTKRKRTSKKTVNKKKRLSKRLLI